MKAGILYHEIDAKGLQIHLVLRKIVYTILILLSTIVKCTIILAVINR